jgi:hypothetical protein
MPLSATAAKTTDAIGASGATPTATATQPSVSAYNYHLAKLPASLDPQHLKAPKPLPRKATAKSTPRLTATPTAAPSTVAPSTVAPSTAAPSSPQFTSGPTHTYNPPTASSPPAASNPAPTSSPTHPTSSPTTSSSGLTPTATAEYQTPTGQNQLAWSQAILKALGDPLTSANIISIGYWMQNEAGSPPSGIVGANNPINVSMPGYGGTQIQYEAPGYYLMSYPTVQDGVAATAAYLNNGSYQGILNALKQGAGLSSSSLASELAEYSGSGYTTIPDSWGQSQGQPLS